MATDPHMISDEALNARYSDEHVIAVRSACEYTDSGDSCLQGGAFLDCG